MFWKPPGIAVSATISKLRSLTELGLSYGQICDCCLCVAKLGHSIQIPFFVRWAQLKSAEAPHDGLYKTVLNIGKRPSIEDGEQRTVELHVMHDYPADFYGQRLKAILLGFIRYKLLLTHIQEADIH